eukprot:CAMPEP_0179975888 /NCGR_PEP_ID=MMETSP0983-20121128/38990_1 /TAXON_ID=483367 /ORGANISM="non described non described, Strain CCMP 2436" /LENGTH=58 /DNA_ID=CAMNT_0021892487 /DNA_START=437 /DNA_END=610 /DNA_ORIENTATION=+
MKGTVDCSGIFAQASSPKPCIHLARHSKVDAGHEAAANGRDGDDHHEGHGGLQRHLRP